MTYITQTNDVSALTLDQGGVLILEPGARITQNGIAADTTDTLTIAGFSHGYTAGLLLAYDHAPDGDSGNVLLISATGMVDGDRWGILATGGDNAITNLGLISSRQIGLQFYSQIGASANRLANFGTIEGDTMAVQGGAGVDVVHNHGQIIGTVDLGAGDDTFDNRGGTVTDSIALGDGNDTFIAGSGEATVDGGTGINTLDFSHASGAVAYALDGSLDPSGWAAMGTFTNFQNATGAAHAANTLTGDANDNVLIGGGKADVLRGGDGNDMLYGGGGADKLYGGAGRDVLSGGAGNDVLYGGGGNDYMTGGSGPDRFVFTGNDLAGSPAITITDFSQGDKDLIDLKGIDANALLSRHQGFSFIGNAAFDGGAGELHYSWIMAGPTGSSPRTVIEGDVNGDGTADFSITLFGHIALTQGDFVL